MTSSHRLERGLTVGFLCLGLALRLARAPLRWHESVLDYAYYAQPTADALVRGDILSALTGFNGLHPPLYGILFSLIDYLAPFPMAWLLFSVLCSFLALLCVTLTALKAYGPTGALIAAAWLSVAPAQLAYAAEPLPYPWLILTLALLINQQLTSAPERHGWWVLLAALATFTHILGGVAALALLAGSSLSLKQKAYRLGWLGLVCLPVMWGVVIHPELAVGDWLPIGPQPFVSMSARAALLWERFGISGYLYGSVTLLLLLVPSSKARPILILQIALSGALVVFLALRQAASHQFPYALVFGPTTALLLASVLSSSRKAGWGVVVLALLVGSSALEEQTHLALDLRAALTRPRGIDCVLDRARAGDAVWLISPYRPDDDKRLTSPVLWRLSPWRAFPVSRGFSSDPSNHRFGMPRARDGIVYYVFFHVFPTEMEMILSNGGGGSRRFFLLLSEPTIEPALAQSAERFALEHGFEEVEVPVDRLWQRR